MHIMKKDSYLETLGRHVEAGKYVTRQTALFALCVGIILGALGMYFGMAQYMSGPNTHQEQNTGTKVPLDSVAPQGQQHQAAILELESHLIVAPNDPKAWAQLGNLYYDAGNPAKSIEAYEKALALKADTPDIWVACGVMYRALKQPEKALEYFNKALTINPKHEFALFNSGVVLHNDLHDDAKAFVAWEKLVGINPQFKTPNGQLLTTILKEHYNTIGQ